MENIKAELASILAHQEEAVKKVDKIIKILEGNGSDGLCTVVSKHDDWIKKRSRVELVFMTVVIGLVVKAIWPLL